MTIKVAITPREKADITWLKAQTISQLVYAGFTLESVRDAVAKNDLKGLVAKNGEKNDS